MEFFNYETKKDIDIYIPNAEMNDEQGIVQKVTKNLFVISNKNKIRFYDYKEKCAKFEYSLDAAEEFKGLCNVNETDFLISFKLSKAEVLSVISLYTIDENEEEENEKEGEEEEEKRKLNILDCIDSIKGDICNLAVTKDGNLIYCNTNGIIKMKYK